MIHHGDCLEWLATLPADSADVCIMDPPYEAEAHTKQRRVKAKGSLECVPLSFGAITEHDRRAVATQLARVVTRWVVAFCQIEAIAAWRSVFESAGLDWVRGGIWRKPDGQPQLTGDRPGCGFESIAIAHRPGRKRWNGGGKHGVWEVPKGCFVPGQKNPHPTMKPEALMLQLVEDFSDIGETIIDPFAGSGTTGVAAIRLGRKFLGAERDDVYHALATERLSAEGQGITLASARSGQVPMFGGVK